MLVAGVVASAAIAAGCGGDAKSSTPKLGMSRATVCTVYGKKISSSAVKRSARQAEAIVSAAYPQLDVDTLKLASYHGDLDPLQAYALHGQVSRAITAHAAKQKGISVDADDVADHLGTLATASNVEVDTMISRITDATDFSKADLQDSARASMLRERIFRKLGKAKASRYESPEQYVADTLVPAAADANAVKCAKGVVWSDNVGQALTAPDGTVIKPSDLASAAIGAAVAGGDAAGTPAATTAATVTTESAPVDPAAAAATYDQQVEPILASMGSVAQRFMRSTNKLTSGKISLKSLAGGYRRQAADLHELEQLAKAARPTDDAYLASQNAKLVAGMGYFADAIEMMGAADSITTTAQLNSLLTNVKRKLDKADTQWTAWQTGLEKDPQGRAYPKIVAKFAAITKALGS